MDFNEKFNPNNSEHILLQEKLLKLVKVLDNCIENIGFQHVNNTMHIITYFNIRRNNTRFKFKRVLAGLHILLIIEYCRSNRRCNVSYLHENNLSFPLSWLRHIPLHSLQNSKQSCVYPY